MIRFFYFLSFCAIVFVLMSHSTGAGLVQNKDRTGSPVANGTCNNCHSGGNFNTSPMLELLENGMPVTEYTPGERYQIRLMINADNNPAGYGFQLTTLDELNNDAGSLENEPGGTRFIKVNDRTYFEQTRRLTENVFVVDWVAPERGTGPIGVYAVGNAVNGNGNTLGDIAGITALMVSEFSAVSETELSQSIQIYPNPSEDFIRLTLPNDVSIQSVMVNDLNGSNIYNSNKPISEIDVTTWSTGVYSIIIQTKDGSFGMKTFAKQ